MRVLLYGRDRRALHAPRRRNRVPAFADALQGAERGGAELGSDVCAHVRRGGEEAEAGGAYDFIFADGAPFADYGPSPYINLTDARGNQYLCHAGALGGSRMPEDAACHQLDEYTSKLT
jgi:hypothetical protein